jgi:hypothetical protein
MNSAELSGRACEFHSHVYGRSKNDPDLDINILNTLGMSENGIQSRTPMYGHLGNMMMNPFSNNPTLEPLQNWPKKKRNI